MNRSEPVRPSDSAGASPVSTPRVCENPLHLKLYILFGCCVLVFFFSWWFLDRKLSGTWAGLSLALAGVYCCTQLALGWVIYWRARWPGPASPPSRRYTVDVLLPVCGEPLDLVTRVVTASLAMRGDHRTWLLDDAADPALERLASRLGIGYLTRKGRQGAKAGNVNAGLARTDGEIVVIFDVDHAPEPDFLEKTLGHFDTLEVGFVQVMLTFNNQEDGPVAQAASETGLDFYNPTSLGMNALGCATLVGSNALIRRKALVSINGYQTGLAEDLATSIALHGAGWKSRYVAEPLAPGLAPPDLSAWFFQQLKWATGVFEVLLKDFPRHFPSLTWGQRLCYLVRGTYYWIGLLVAVHLALTLVCLVSGNEMMRIEFSEYLAHFTPLAMTILLIRNAALRTWRHPEVSQRLSWRPFVLVISTWPVYALAFLMTLLRVPLEYCPTPKKKAGGLNPVWLAPQIFGAGMLLAGVMYFLLIHRSPASGPLLSMAFGLAGLHLALVRNAVKAGAKRSSGEKKHVVEQSG